MSFTYELLSASFHSVWMSDEQWWFCLSPECSCDLQTFPRTSRRKGRNEKENQRGFPNCINHHFLELRMRASLHQLILKFCSQRNHGSVEILSASVSPGAGAALPMCCSQAFRLRDLCRRSVPQLGYPCREKLLLILNLNLPRRKDLAHYACSLPRGCGSNHSVPPASGSLLRIWKLLACLFSAFSSLLKESFWSSLVGYACQTALVLISVSWILSSASSRPLWGPSCAEWNEKGPPHVLHAARPSKNLPTSSCGEEDPDSVSARFCPLRSILVLLAWAPNAEPFESVTASSFWVFMTRWQVYACQNSSV